MTDRINSFTVVLEQDLPSPYIVQEIMELFGFKHSVTDFYEKGNRHPDLHIYVEPSGAINIIEKL